MGTANRSRKSYNSEFKVTVVLESMQRDTTIEAVCRKYGVHSSLVNRWRKEFKENIGKVFEDKRSLSCRGALSGYPPGQSPDDLKRIIGELTVENDILKKASRLLG
jgi:transposase-like protein